MADQKGRFEFDFMPIGQAIKKAREAKGMTREQLAGIIGYAPRHIQAIENEGQYPSFELLFNSQLYSIFPWIKLECVSKCREMQFRAYQAAIQGDFPQAYWLQVKEKQRRSAALDAENALQAF